ncbi:MAG: SDR family NAD(P)-dependent oxidoreductase [Betaproteobacteria bacterium]|nr:MAG: SDR family NAD(P)-dependent oxidoreductase [Betaproteobacteria bacterium]
MNCPTDHVAQCIHLETHKRTDVMQKIALVTGAHGNLGRAVVGRFLEDQYAVIGVDATQHPSSGHESAERYESHSVDLMNEDAAGAFVQSVIAKHSRIDVAVLTVGGFAMGSIAETKTADIAHQYKLNFETAYNVARPVFLQMMNQGTGRLFLVGARPALSATGSKGMIAYGLAKSLIFRLAELMNDEAAGTDVHVAVIVPSIIDTPQNRAAMPDADFAKWVTPEAIAAVIARQVSDAPHALHESVVKVYGDA